VSADLRRELDQLHAEIQLLHAQDAAREWKFIHDRFHAFDAIKNDKCPACGARVRVIETDRAVKLEALQ
jgi:hypothetical protein